MKFLLRILMFALLGNIAAAQATYARWWEYESHLHELTAQQFSTTTLLAQEGNEEAEMLVAEAYHRGIFVEANKDQWHMWERRAAEHGNPEAQFTLATYYARGEAGFPQDVKQEAHWLRRAAEQGHIVAEFNLALAYFDGRGVSRDLPLGETWLRKSADADFTQAQAILGGMYFRGNPLPRDYAKAEVWLSKAAEHGHSGAIGTLARLYAANGAMTRDPQFVEGVLIRGAELADAISQYQLARMYRQGFLGRPDFARAMEWSELSARKGFAPADFQLGEMYEAGEGTPADLTTAAQHYQRAAELGYSPAVFKGGEMYRDGRGVTLDTSAAYRWFLIGATLGASDSKEALAQLQKRLKQEVIDSNTTEAQTWMNAHPEPMSQAPGEFRYRTGIMVRDDPPPAREPSTEEERTMAIKLAHELELNPLGDAADKSRRWLSQWMDLVPDIFFLHCDLFRDDGMAYPYRVPVMRQLSYSAAAHRLEHPEKVRDQLLTNLAGLQGALRAYESVVQQHPDQRWPLLDNLLQRRLDGSLPDFVHEKTNKLCR